MLTFSLVSIANASTENGYVDPPLGQMKLGGISFFLPPGENSVTTQAESLPDNPTKVSLELQVANPQRVYLLLTGGNLYTRYDNAVVGIVRLYYASGDVQSEFLSAGLNLREWKKYDQETVDSTTAGNVTQVWSTGALHAGTGIIDMLTIDVEPAYQTSTLTAVEIEDTSVETVYSMDPAINWLGLTVLGGLDASMIESTVTPCLVTGLFTGIWAGRQDELGCAVGLVETATFTIQAYEEGYLVWSKQTDQIYVLPNNNNWYRHPNAWREGTDIFSCDEARTIGQPVMGFGKLWCENPSTQQALGIPISQEQPDNNGRVQFFEKGFIIRGYGGQTFLLFDDLNWELVF